MRKVVLKDMFVLFEKMMGRLRGDIGSNERADA